MNLSIVVYDCGGLGRQPKNINKYGHRTGATDDGHLHERLGVRRRSESGDGSIGHHLFGSGLSVSDEFAGKGYAYLYISNCFSDFYFGLNLTSADYLKQLRDDLYGKELTIAVIEVIR